MRSALWLSLVGGFPARELFCTPSALVNGIPKLLGDGGGRFLQVIRLQGFSWYDFASFDDSSSAKLGHFYRGIRGWGEFLKVALLFFLRRVSKENRARGSVCGSKNDKPRAPEIKFVKAPP